MELRGEQEEYRQKRKIMIKEKIGKKNKKWRREQEGATGIEEQMRNKYR